MTEMWIEQVVLALEPFTDIRSGIQVVGGNLKFYISGQQISVNIDGLDMIRILRKGVIAGYSLAQLARSQISIYEQEGVYVRETKIDWVDDSLVQRLDLPGFYQFVGRAESGKTQYMKKLQYLYAKQFLDYGQRLLLLVEAHGRSFSHIDDLLAATLNQYRSTLTAEQLLVLVRHGIVGIVFDGFSEFNEYVDTQYYVQAFDMLHNFVRSFDGTTAVIINTAEVAVPYGTVIKIDHVSMTKTLHISDILDNDVAHQMVFDMLDMHSTLIPASINTVNVNKADLHFDVLTRKYRFATNTLYLMNVAHAICTALSKMEYNKVEPAGLSHIEFDKKTLDFMAVEIGGWTVDKKMRVAELLASLQHQHYMWTLLDHNIERLLDILVR